MPVKSKTWLQLQASNCALLLSDRVPILAIKCGVDLNLWQQDSIEIEAKVRDFSVVDSESDLVRATQVSAKVKVFVDIESQLWQRITTEQI
jgi:hypothetical protein